MRSMSPRLPSFDYMLPANSRFVGRHHELRLILSQYQVTREGSARVVLLVGEPGIGKTRLLDEVAVRALHNGAILLRGEASDSEGMPPYLPFLEALGRYIRATPLDQLREQVGIAPQVLASILPELTGRLGELPAAYALPPEQMRLRLYEAIGSFLELISASHPLVLTLDDLQWADSASLDLLCHIIRHQSKAKLLVVGSYREGEIGRNTALDRAVIELRRQRVLTHVEVDPLSAEEIEALAVSYLGGPISPMVKQILYAHSEGNPFFAEELLYGWLENGDLAQEDRLWVPVSPLEHALPSSIIAALRQRLVRLSPVTIDHLRVASAIGRTFELSLLMAVGGQSAEAVEDHLLEAVNAYLIRAIQPGVYLFEHNKIRETLYAEVSTSRRQHVHELIGLALEDRYAQKNTHSTYQLAELAFHFTHSGKRERGVTYSQQAAEQAMQSFAPKEAMAHYQKALELIDAPDGRRGDLLFGLGQAALLARMEGDAAAAYQEALSWSLQCGELGGAARAAHGLGLTYWRQGALQEARAALERALELSKGSSSTQVVRVLVDLATLLTVYIGEQGEGTSYVQQAQEMADQVGDNLLQATITSVVARKGYVPVNDLPLTLQSMERALVILEAIGDPCEATECALYLASLYYWMAEIRRSFEVSMRCLEFGERCQQPCQLREVSSWLALLYASQGRWGEAEQAIERTKAIITQIANPIPLGFLHQIRGFLAYQRHEYVTAEREFRAALQNQQSGLHSLMLHTGLLGLTQVALGKQEAASASMAELESLLDELPADTLPTAPLLLCLALLALAADDRERLTKLYPKLLSFKGQHYWFLVDRILGMICMVSEEWEIAMEHLAEAEAAAQREGLVPELAHTLLAQADCELAGSGQEREGRARDLLVRALALFEELNLADAITEVRSRLRALTGQSQDTSRRSLPANLTKSEVKVLQLVAQGKSSRQIAEELSVSGKTVTNHLTHIFMKTGSKNRVEATNFAIRHGLV